MSPRPRALALLASLWLPFHFVSAEEATGSAPDDLSRDLPPILARHNVPGMVFLALRGDQTLGQGAAGVRLAGDKTAVTLGDKFHLGSCTKAMTATLLAMEVEGGKLAWDTLLSEACGDLAPHMKTEWKTVTLRQVLAHRAGLAANPSPPLKKTLNQPGKPLDQQRRELADAVLTDGPLTPPGSKYTYSNIGYILAGAIVEKLEKRPWEEVMRQRLYTPLAITSGGFGPVGTMAHDQPRGHRENGDPAPVAADNPAFYGPAGTAHMTIADWAKFIALHLRGDPANPHAEARLLKPETFAAIHARPAEGNYNAGWIVETRPWAKGTAPSATGRVLTHSGSNTMYHCTVWIAPEIDFAALVACNQGGPAAGKACDEAIGVLIRKYVKR